MEAVKTLRIMLLTNETVKTRHTCLFACLFVCLLVCLWIPLFVVCLFVCLILLSLNLQRKTRRAREIERGRDPGSQRKPRTPADTSEPAITNVKGPLGRTACGGRTGNMVIGRGLSPYTVEMGVPGFARHTHFHNAGPVYGAAAIS